MNKVLLIFSSVIIVIVVGLVAFQSSEDEFNLPVGGETKLLEEISEEELNTTAVEGIIETGEMKEEKETIQKSERPIMVTDGVRHSVLLGDILSGGPPKDGIPSIDDPKFVTVKEANEWLNDGEPGIALSIGDTNRFYPYQILVWHEIVNDVIPASTPGGDDQRVLVTYCPLCLTGIVFDPVVEGKRVEFGTSGKLWESNLVMYDRKTDGLWSQVLGEAIVGNVTGTILPTISSDQVLYGDWKKKFSNGEVLSRDTGEFKFYGTNPYDNYFTVTNFSLNIVSNRDDRLPNDTFVFGLLINGKAKAYDISAVKKKGEIRDNFAGEELILRHDTELDVVRVFKILPSGTEERINPFSSFWFSWAAAHPDTELYK